MDHTKDKDNHSYRNILKSTSLFGGVQIFQVLVNLIRGKFIAIFLGPAGMGINSLFNSASLTIQGFAGLGLKLAVVREVSASKDDSDKLQTILAVIKRLLLFTSLLGALLCIVFSVPLSRLTFGNDNYAWQFVLLSVVVCFGIAGEGFYAVLQGLQEKKRLAVNTIAGSLVGLFIGVPLYILFGDAGIVPALAALSLSVFIASFVGLRKSLPDIKEKFDWASHKAYLKKLLIFGCLLMSNDMINTGCVYLLNIFIRYMGQITDVGLYQAASSLTNQYSGLVFTAMLLDFYPRLASVAGDNEKVKNLVNMQLVVVALMVTPLVCLLILTSPWVIEVLLTDKFLSIVPLMRWLGLGILFKALMFPLGYIAFAKDNKKVFFWLEAVFCNLLTLSLSVFFYLKMGLIGLGISLSVDCALCIAIYYVVNARLYSYSMSGKVVREILLALILAAFCCGFSLDWPGMTPLLSYGAMAFITIVSSGYSLVSLRRLLRR